MNIAKFLRTDLSNTNSIFGAFKIVLNNCFNALITVQIKTFSVVLKIFLLGHGAVPLIRIFSI